MNNKNEMLKNNSDLERKLFFVTCCDHQSKRVNTLRESLGGNLIVLDSFDKSIGSISKFIEVAKYLDEDTNIQSDDVVVFMDGFDVLCINKDVDSMLTDFINLKVDIVVGAENKFSHQLSSVREFYETKYCKHTMRYVNSGFYLGYKASIIKMLSYCLKTYPLLCEDDRNVEGKCGDQTVLSRFMFDNEKACQVSMTLDHSSRFVYTYNHTNLTDSHESAAPYFLHVCWLANPACKSKYDELVSHIQPA